MSRLPHAFLTLPPPGDPTLSGLSRRVRLLGVRALLTASVAPALRARVAAQLQADGPAALRRAGGMDVLPWLLCLAGGVLPPRECAAGLSAAWDGASAAARPLAPGLELALEDTNPLAGVEAHPDKQGDTLDLGGRSPEDWAEVLTAALDTVTRALPEWAAEVRPHAARRWVPAGADAIQHRSASFREAPGLAYLSLHPDGLTMAEAIVHEGQHSALNLLSWFDPLLTDAPDVVVASPVRPDPRPLRGVLLAVHAFVPVAAMHLRLHELGDPLAAESGFPARRREVLEGNAEGLEVLRRHAHPTALGARVLDDLRALHGAVADAWEPLS